MGLGFRSSKRRDDEGFTLIELVAALGLITFGILALVSSMGLGFRTIALGRQRQTASEVANARIEHLRNIPYVEVSLAEPLVYSSDPANPDHFVSSDGAKYDYSGGATYEDVVVGFGAVAHFESPVVVGATKLNVYQYVTWVNDPESGGTHAYKRVTVVVEYMTPSVGGVSKMVRASSFFTPGNVTLGGGTPGPGGGTASPTPTASGTPSPTPTSADCVDDHNAPTGSLSIESTTGSAPGFTASMTVTLKYSVQDPCTPITLSFSNDGVAYGVDVPFDPYNPSVSWILSDGEGPKSVWARVRDGVGNELVMGPQHVILDSTNPTVPGTLTRTVSCSGGTRTVSLLWQSSSDTYLLGYRIYRSVDMGAWTELVTTSGTSYTEGGSKGQDSVRYYVIAYDKAGNKSDATNTVSLSKQECS